MPEEEVKKSSEPLVDSTEGEPTNPTTEKQETAGDATTKKGLEDSDTTTEKGLVDSDGGMGKASKEGYVQDSSIGSSASKPQIVEKSPSKEAVESTTSENKSPQKIVGEKENVVESGVAEAAKKISQSVVEADSTESDATGNTSKPAAGDDKAKEHLKLLGEGKKAFANNDFLSAADYFGRAAELSRIVFGEFSEKNGETLFLYGATMLECWKNDSAVLGENMKGKDDDEGYDDEEDDEDDDEEEGEKNEDEGADDAEKMETDESEAKEVGVNGDVETPAVNGGTKSEVLNGEAKETGDGPKLNGSAEGSEAKEPNQADPSSSNAEDKDEDKEDEDNYLKIAWEMLDLAKIIYHKVDDKKRLADTYMKLGEVAVESGHVTATEEMKKCLDLRLLFLEPHHRVIAETHFNIGVAFSVFKLFDEATKHFEEAKKILENKMKILKETKTEESLKEFKEIEGIIPELNEKIQDMADSKRDELNKGQAAADDSNGCSSSTASAPSEAKPASNISHLVKRKRKVDDIVAEKSTKVCRVEADDKKVVTENPAPKD